VVDRASVVTTHLSEVVSRNAGRLLSRQDVKMLIETVKASNPVVVDELGSAQVSLAEVQRVLQALLDEQVGVRDLVRILEVISERSRVTKDLETITEAVRAALGPAISAAHAFGGRLHVIGLDPLLEHTLTESLRAGENGSFLALEPEDAQLLLGEIANLATGAEQLGQQPVLLCAAALRPALTRLVRGVLPGVPVLSYVELGPQLELETIGVVSLAQPAAV
jgi:flagellar biosynthesis protein FlhA